LAFLSRAPGSLAALGMKDDNTSVTHGTAAISLNGKLVKGAPYATFFLAVKTHLLIP
jgi:hypothetical protein